MRKVETGMEGYFTIAQISAKVKRSKQAIYKLISNNQELGEILPDNTITIGKGKQYSQAVLTWIKDYYERTADNEPEAEDAEEAQASADNLEMALLRQEVEHLKEKLATAENLLEEARAEKKELRQENGALLLLLGQEKQEKQQLLLEVKNKENENVIQVPPVEQEEQAPTVETITEEQTPVEQEPEPAQESKQGFFARWFGKKKGARK